MKRAIGLGLFATLVIAVGCASAPLQTGNSDAAIRAAEEVGAAGVPQASLHLQLAKEQLETAKTLSKRGDHEQAASMLLRADADAELAVMLSRGDNERIEAEQARERVRQLRHDNP